MKYLNKIAGYNLLAILVYSILIRAVSGGGSHNDQNLGILLFSAIAVGIHVLACLLMAAFTYSGEDKQLGKAWLLSAGIVLVVGFSACLGNAAL
jgi:hypothetical protein